MRWFRCCFLLPIQFGAAVALAFHAPGAYAADDTSPPPQSSATTKTITSVSPGNSDADTTAEKFAALVKAGDRARAQGRLADALGAYRDALTLRDDPTLYGRIGLIALAASVPAIAAGELLEAISRGGGATPAERAQFLRAYGAIRPKVCRVSTYVPIVDSAIIVAIDGRTPDSPAGGPGAYQFVMPGRHSIRISAEGYEELNTEFDAPAGGEVNLQFELKRIGPEPVADKTDPVPTPAPLAQAAPVSPSRTRATSPLSRAALARKSQPMPGRAASTRSWLPEVDFSGGALASYGRTVTWKSGLFLACHLKWQRRFSVVAEGRGLLPVPAEPVATPTGTSADVTPAVLAVALSPCVHEGVMAVCGVFEAGRRDFYGGEEWDAHSTNPLSLAGGLQAGVSVPFANRFAFRGYAEGLITSTGELLLEGERAWVAPSGTLTLGAGLVMKY